MNAYLLQSHKTIEPFGDHPGDCLITNRRLRDLQEDVLRSLGIACIHVSNKESINDEGEHLAFSDSLFFTRELLEDFIERSRRVARPTYCAVKPCIASTRGVVATQDVHPRGEYIEYALEYSPPAGCVIAPGRTIPNGTRLAPEESHVIRKCIEGEEVPGYRRVLPTLIGSPD